ncbi:MAG: O-methyltransferase [Fusobacteriaceae bacterium]|jgi:caffeoyl-CoA O-methyltransferase|nr:O-methyltransferase [Fusobacteriaceae bacterium]
MKETEILKTMETGDEKTREDRTGIEEKPQLPAIVHDYLAGRIRKRADKYAFAAMLKRLEGEARERGIPIVSPEVREYLRFIAENPQIRHVLEIGTATGYSGIVLADAIRRRGGELVTIEKDGGRAREAATNFAACGLDNVRLLHGDALEWIPALTETFDLIFIDAAKGRYPDFYAAAYGKLRAGGLVFIDNILFRGYVCGVFPGRYKTIARRMGAFIDALYEGEDDFALLPFGDGVGLVRKRDGTS